MIMSSFIYFGLFLALYVISKHLLHKIQKLPPSPFPSLPIIGHLYLLKPPLYRALAKISDRHGPLILLQFGVRKVLVVSSPSLAEECFTKNDIVFANRPPLLTAKHFTYNYTHLAWAPYGDHWRNLRRIASLELLSAHRLQTLSAIRLDEVRTLIRRLHSNQNQVVEMKTLLFELTLNIMMRMIAGKRYYGDNLSDVEEARRFQEIQKESFELNKKPNIGDFLPWMQSKRFEKRLIECQRNRDDFLQAMIEEQRRKRMEKDDCGADQRKKNFIQVLLSLQEAEPQYYADIIIKGFILVLLLAGTDSTVNTIEWGFSLLLNHPEVLEKARLEIENQAGNDRLIDESDLSQLPYLRNIINETMRMYPTGPLLLPHESSEDCAVGGFHIARGTMLFVNAWAMQNDPKIWVDPREFRPERFQGLEGAKDDNFKFIPFGRGRRSCPGEGLGLRVIGLALGSLIQCFEWERIGNKMVDMTEGVGFSMPKAQPLKVVCRPHPNMLNLLSQI